MTHEPSLLVRQPTTFWKGFWCTVY